MKKTGQNLIQAYQHAPWRVQLQFIGLFLLVLVMIAVVAGIYLNVTARADTVGREIQTLQDDILAIQRVNADLETNLALLTSATTMEERAKELGFRHLDPDEVNYVSVTGYGGRREIIFAPPPGPVISDSPDLPPEYTQTLVEWVEEFVLNPPDSLVEVLP